MAKPFMENQRRSESRAAFRALSSGDDNAFRVPARARDERKDRDVPGAFQAGKHLPKLLRQMDDRDPPA